MITFLISLLLLIVGYVIYGRIVERIFRPDPNAKTPCYTNQDNVDYIPMPTWKVFLIQFLNIAGTGPIFGAIQGILFGPAAFFWIVLGCIFGGAVHDYMSGMISLRNKGISLPEIIGDQLGNTT
ncbi:MAG: carbon starvation protein A, partial [Bacteroidaceae bacterium]|nr:carbon starvation protein A [Bacteroidaceae bacterium]